jgi:hypothetical protein
VVATLHCDVQFCPFKAAGEAAGQAALKQKVGGPRRLLRRATSFISPEHKGVLTVTVIGASNLTVMPCPAFTPIWHLHASIQYLCFELAWLDSWLLRLLWFSIRLMIQIDLLIHFSRSLGICIWDLIPY